MSSYSDKPWLKSYRLGAFKLETTLDFPNKPLYSILDETAEKYSNKDAYDYSGRRMKYKELKEQVDRLANALDKLGVKKGDKVMIVIPTSPQFIISDFAVLKTGAILVPCSPLLKVEDLKYQAVESKAETIICDNYHLKYVQEIKDDTHLKNIIVFSLTDYSQNESKEIKEFPGAISFRGLIKEHEPKAPLIKINPKEDLAILAFTGGSTGIPKGVMLTHYQRLSNLHQGLPWMMSPMQNLKGTASALIGIPIFHSAGHYIVQSCILWGFRSFLIPDPRNIKLIVKTMNEYRPIFAFLVPTQLMQMAKPNIEIKRMPVLIISGSAPLPKEIGEKIEAKTKMPVSESYGLTETSPVTHINISAIAKITRFAKNIKTGIGLPVPDTEVKLVDPVTGKDVPFGEVGEVWIRGPQVMKGYWPKSGSGLEKGGWLRTGDLAKMDEEGYFYIVDRIKDMINVSGLKVYSVKVDEVLFEHPAVLSAATIGIPDPKRPGSERIKVFIKLHANFLNKISEKDIIDYCKEKLPPYAVPRVVEFRADLPLTVTEKLFKRVLREEEINKMKEQGLIRPD